MRNPCVERYNALPPHNTQDWEVKMGFGVLCVANDKVTPMLRNSSELPVQYYFM